MTLLNPYLTFVDLKPSSTWLIVVGVFFLHVFFFFFFFDLVAECSSLTVFRCSGLSEEREKAIFEAIGKVFDYIPAPGSENLQIYNAKIFEMRKRNLQRA